MTLAAWRCTASAADVSDPAEPALAEPGDDAALVAARGGRRLRAAGSAGDRAVARAGRRASASGRRRPAGRATPGCGSPSLCRGGFFTAPTRPSGAAALADNRRAIDEAAELGRRVPGHGGRRPAGRRPGPGRRPRRRVADALGRAGAVRRRARRAAGHRAAAPDVLRRPRRASPRSARRWTSPSRTRPTQVGRRGRHLPRLVGPAGLRSRSPGPGEPDRQLPGVRLHPAAPGRRPARPRA